MFTVGGAVFTVGGAVFTLEGAVFTVGGAVFTVEGVVFTVGGAVFTVGDPHWAFRFLPKTKFFQSCDFIFKFPTSITLYPSTRRTSRTPSRSRSTNEVPPIMGHMTSILTFLGSGFHYLNYLEL